MRIYISGPVTENEDFVQDFKRAEEWLKLNDDYIPVNPTIMRTLPLGYAGYLAVDMKLIELCDGIYMLSGWQKSKGACAELAYAKVLGKKVKYEDMQVTFKKSLLARQEPEEELYTDLCSTGGEL